MVESKGVYRINLGGGDNMRKPQNLNCKFKKFGFLDILKAHIQSNYLTRTTLSYLQTKLAEKKQETNFIMFSILQLQFWKV